MAQVEIEPGDSLNIKLMVFDFHGAMNYIQFPRSGNKTKRSIEFFTNNVEY